MTSCGAVQGTPFGAELEYNDIYVALARNSRWWILVTVVSLHAFQASARRGPGGTSPLCSTSSCRLGRLALSGREPGVGVESTNT